MEVTVVEGPRCSLRTRKVYSDLSVDYLKMFLINVPAAVVALGLEALMHQMATKAGILTQEDNGDASNSNQNTSNQFSDAR